MAAVNVFSISAEFEPLNVGAAAFSTLIGLGAATGVMLVLRHMTEQPVRNFWIVSTLALLVSVSPNIALWMNPEHIEGTTLPAILALALMHVVAFGIAVPWLTRAAKMRT